MSQIYGQRIRLRASEREDIPLFLNWINDPEVTENLLLAFPFSLTEEEKWYEEMIAKPPSEHVLVIEVRDPNQTDNFRTIGTCQFFKIDWRNRSSEVGIMIGEKRLWNQGYGTETMKLLLKHGFETLNLHKNLAPGVRKEQRGYQSL